MFHNLFDNNFLIYFQVSDGIQDMYHPDPTRTFMAALTGLMPYNSYGIVAGSRVASINVVNNSI